MRQRIRSGVIGAQATFACVFIVNALAVLGQAQATQPVTQLSANFYAIHVSGANVGALAGPDGVLLVDSGYRQADTGKILAAIRSISDAPIRFVVNTSAGIDHTGGNETFSGLGATILPRPRAPERLLMSGEEIDLIPVPHAFSDGDILVHFVNADVIMTGELFQSVSYPHIDRANGGTLRGLLDGLAAVAAMAGPKTKIVPGHDTIADRAAVIAQRDMILVLRDRVQAMLNQGASEKEVVAARLNADYPSTRLGPDRFIRELYEELESAR